MLSPRFQFEKKPLGLAIGRHVADAQCHRVAQGRELDALSVNQNGALARGPKSGKARRKGTTARTQKPHQADDFAGVNGEVDTGKCAGQEKVSGREQWFSDLATADVGAGADIAADHFVNQNVSRDRACLVAGNDATVAQDSNPIGQGCDLVQMMADVDYSNAFGPEAANKSKQRILLICVQRGRWLVKQQQSGIER